MICPPDGRTTLKRTPVTTGALYMIALVDTRMLPNHFPIWAARLSRRGIASFGHIRWMCAMRALKLRQ
jgi:hypothetical protein